MGGYSATKSAQVGFAESLRAEFGGTADPRQRASFRSRRDTEFRDVMARDYGHSVTGLGPKQTVDDGGAARSWRACERPAPEVYPHAQVARAGRAQRRRAWLHRSLVVRKYGRQPRGRDR